MLAFGSAMVLAWLAYARVPIRLGAGPRTALTLLRALTLMLLIAILLRPVVMVPPAGEPTGGHLTRSESGSAMDAITQGTIDGAQLLINIIAMLVVLVALVERLRERGFTLLDTQWVTPHLAQFGAVEVARDEYLRRLGDAIRQRCSFA